MNSRIFEFRVSSWKSVSEFETFLTPSSAFSDSLSDGNLKITWYIHSIILSIKMEISRSCLFQILTTCSSSAPELSSGMVSGKTVSFGDDTQIFCKWYGLNWISHDRNNFKTLFCTYVVVQLFHWSFVSTLIRKRTNRLTRWTFNI